GGALAMSGNVPGNTTTINNNVVLNSDAVGGAFNTFIGVTTGTTSVNTLTIGGNISGASDVTTSAGSSVGGAGILNLNGTNSWTGATYMRNAASGVVKMGSNNALPSTTALQFGGN